ncbi:glycosyltransferase [Pseudohoeflea coraliihabitans]|uniref:Glycosyltransferase n=1 Tax=Pseudohoeflea coraliihabitans TaxID=2860393 RepID=A0ABS6WLR9_9HYPH|nr:glycosyltransferase [Pseudohoeflea sp. DP4N28-3]MBW3096075.1 glycosyltransferase [Pseudohoeflea sp. DP4N28-3]
MKRCIYLDVTGLIAWGPAPPTGIQRVERSLLHAAADYPDVRPAYVTRKPPRLVPLGPSALSQLRGLLAPRPDAISLNDRLGQLWQYYILNRPVIRNETARELARIALASNQQKGTAYQTLKAVFRFLLLIDKALQMLLALLPFRAAAARSEEDGVALLCFETARRTGGDIRLPPAVRPAFLIYDLMPVRQPELSMGHRTEMMGHLLRRVIARSDILITISQTVRADLEDFEKNACDAPSRRRAKAIQLGSSAVNHDAATTPIAELENKRFALFCSSIETKKSHHVLVAAWEQLIAELGPEAVPYLAFIGRRDTAYERLTKALDENPAARRRTVLLHDVDDSGLRWAYRNAALGLFASSFEGWGLGVSESLAYGLPVIHSPHPALREAAQDLMPCPAEDTPECWADTLRPYLRDPERIAVLKARIAQDYRPRAPDEFARQLFDHLRTVSLTPDADEKPPVSAGMRSDAD